MLRWAFSFENRNLQSQCFNALSQALGYIVNGASEVLEPGVGFNLKDMNICLSLGVFLINQLKYRVAAQALSILVNHVLLHRFCELRNP